MIAAVWLREVRVGTLERFDDDTHTFSFDEDYLRRSDRPVIGQLFEDRLPRDISTHGMTPWFQELLPQGPLRKAIAQQAGADADDDFSLLVWLGEDLPGAVRITVDESQRRPPLARALARSAPPTATLRVSLAGMQWKVALSRTDKGLTLPVRGQESEWIAKFQGRELPRLVQVEHATMLWARKAGLDVPDVDTVDISEIEGIPESVPTGDGRVLLVRRFDRGSQGRIHFEDFAQVLDRPDPYGGSHEDIARFLVAESPNDRDELVRRLAFIIATGNSDAHLKNWAFIYRDARRGVLAPAYDQIATVVFPQFPAKFALKVGGQKERRISDLTRADLDQFASAMQTDAGALSDRLSRELDNALVAFEAVADLFNTTEQTAIRNHHSRLKLLR